MEVLRFLAGDTKMLTPIEMSAWFLSWCSICRVLHGGFWHTDNILTDISVPSLFIIKTQNYAPSLLDLGSVCLVKPRTKRNQSQQKKLICTRLCCSLPISFVCSSRWMQYKHIHGNDTYSDIQRAKSHELPWRTENSQCSVWAET